MTTKNFFMEIGAYARALHAKARVPMFRPFFNSKIEILEISQNFKRKSLKFHVEIFETVLVHNWGLKLSDKFVY